MTPLEQRQQQVMRGWVRMLDVDLDLAQQMLRLPPAQRPTPPIAVPAVFTDTWDGSREQLVAAIPAPEPDEPAPTVAPVISAAPKGAYARRARKA